MQTSLNSWKKKAFPIIKVMHLDSDGLFMFDNSQNQHAKPLDALSVNILNLKDGGKIPDLCATDGSLEGGSSKNNAQPSIMREFIIVVQVK
jgi:hypothetical protein